jgi:hypothetical protein
VHVVSRVSRLSVNLEMSLQQELPCHARNRFAKDAKGGSGVLIGVNWRRRRLFAPAFVHVTWSTLAHI